ncbi:tetratricopeptide repeat protein [Nonomuraea wenchangensis]|uniref:tetratricopeptide repeat protein n=1 Tax=Nonomuraea wenchangensis TaxID=568860 RepID=UPI0033E6BB6E
MTEPPSLAGAVPQGKVQVNAPGAGGVVNAVQDGVLNVHQWKPAYRIEDFPAEPRPVRPARARAQPSLLLRAGSQVVPFTGRQEDLRTLTGWRDDEAAPGLGVRLLHGPGGQGKTRLAARFAELSRQAGWRVWQASTNPPGAVRASAVAGADARGAGLLLVVDYAERWPVPALYELLQEPVLRAGRVRVLLLARPAGVWWDSIAAWAERVLDLDADAQALPPLVAEPAMRQRLFAEARDHFAAALALPAEQAATIAPPAGLADDAEYAQVLTVHIAALAAVDAHRHGEEEPGDPARASAYLLRREREHWAELHRRLPEPLVSDPVTMGRAVFTATFTRPLARPDARRALRHADLAETVERVNTLLDDHAYCYPPAQAGTVLEPLYPDRLAEDFAALAIPDPAVAGLAGDDWAGHALSGLLSDPAGQGGQGQVPPWIRPALTMLIETARRWPHVAATQLYPLLATRPELMLYAGGATLARLAGLPGIEPALLQHIEAHLPAGRHIDLDIGTAALSTRLTAHRLATTTDPAEHAALHSGHAVRLANAGQHRPALEASRQAVTLYRELAGLNRDACLPYLAMSLTNHALLLAEMGRRAEAVEMSEQAVALYRELAGLDRDAHLPNLTTALNNHATRLAEMGRRAEAVEMSEQAVALYGELAERNRHAYLPDLVMSLHNHALRLAEMGRRAEAVEFSEQAVPLRRQLADLNRDAFLPDLAMSLNNHAIWLAKVGRRAEAVEVSKEAVALRRELAGLNRDAFLRDLAMSLGNHANRLMEMRRWAEAVEVSEEAVALCRELTELNRDAFLRDLAMSLSNHALLLAGVERQAEAVPISEQAVALCRELVELNRDAFLPDLATSLGNHATQLAQMRRWAEAVVVSEQAVALYGELAGLNRNAFLSELATSLNNHALRLAEVERRAEAVEVSEQAVAVCRELAELNRDAHLPELARSLSNHALLLAGVERRAEAVPISEQAVALFEESARFNRDAYLPELATSLNNHLLRLAEVGRWAETVPISEQAVALRRELVELDRDAHLPDLALSLSNHAALLAEVGRRPEAVVVSEQAVALRRELTELNRDAHLPDYVQSLVVRGWTLSEARQYGDAVRPLAEALAAGQELPEFARELLHDAVAVLREAHQRSPAEVDAAFETVTGRTFTEWVGEGR